MDEANWPHLVDGMVYLTARGDHIPTDTATPANAAPICHRTAEIRTMPVASATFWEEPRHKASQLSMSAVKWPVGSVLAGLGIPAGMNHSKDDLLSLQAEFDARCNEIREKLCVLVTNWIKGYKITNNKWPSKKSQKRKMTNRMVKWIQRQLRKT